MKEETSLGKYYGSPEYHKNKEEYYKDLREREIPVTLYQKFKVENFDRIQEEFKKKDKNISNLFEIETYKGWEKKGRKVMTGSKGIKVTSPNTYANAIYGKDGKVLHNKNGGVMIRNVLKTYSFFDIKQTK